ncbi:hypothetical protein, partial [Proteus terrae]
KQTGSPLALLTYGEQLQRVLQREQALLDDPAERHVQRVWANQAHVLAERLRDPAAALQRERDQLEGHLQALRQLGADANEIAATER